jgi:HSP20 family protein
MISTNPFEMMRELAAMQERMNRAWANVYDRRTDDVRDSGSWLPPVDIYRGDAGEMILKADLPGVRRDDIDLTVENNTLTIRGQRRRDEAIEEAAYQRMERSYGPFSRSFTLPDTVDAAGVRAEHRDGVLTIKVPVREAVKARQIQVTD